jgi:hypothetical protein
MAILIRRNPIPTILAGFGLGFALATIKLVATSLSLTPKMELVADEIRAGG